MDERELADEVHRLLGRLVHASARFDFNMGLQLVWLGPYCQVPVAQLLDKRVPFNQRLQMLRRLVLDVFAHENDDAREAFAAWFNGIDKAKALRNDYAHGRWGFQHGLQLADPEFDFVALDWEMDKAKQAPAIRLRLSSLAREVAAVESLFNEYRRLEREFEWSARPPRARDEQDGTRLRP